MVGHRKQKVPPKMAAELEDEPRILVVEDDDAVRAVYERTLQRAGFRCLPVGSIGAARGVLNNEAEHFDAAVLDFELPDGTAFDLVGDLLRRQPLCKSLVITGVAGPAEAQHFVQLGAHAFIAKPLRPAALVGGVINTVYATLQWRRQTNQTLGEVRKPDAMDLTVTDAPGPVSVDPNAVIDRIRHLGGLTPVQTVVAYRLIWGDADREIAELLDCAERTVKRHVASVLRRTGARTRSGMLGVLFRDAGFEDTGEQEPPPLPED